MNDLSLEKAKRDFAKLKKQLAGECRKSFDRIRSRFIRRKAREFIKKNR